MPKAPTTITHSGIVTLLATPAPCPMVETIAASGPHRVGNIIRAVGKGKQGNTENERKIEQRVDLLLVVFHVFRNLTGDVRF